MNYIAASIIQVEKQFVATSYVVYPLSMQVASYANNEKQCRKSWQVNITMDMVQKMRLVKSLIKRLYIFFPRIINTSNQVSNDKQKTWPLQSLSQER